MIQGNVQFVADLDHPVEAAINFLHASILWLTTQ